MTRKRSRQNFNNQTDRLDETQDDRAGLIFGKNTVLSYLEKLNEDNVECEESGINKIFLYEGATGDPRLGKIKKLAKDLRIPAIEVAREKIDALSGPRANHQGVVASLSPIKILSQAELLELIDRELESLKALELSTDGYTVVALDGIEDPRNLGAIVRCAEVMGARAIIVPERRAAGINETVAKTSAGAIAHIPIARVTNLTKVIEILKEKGFWSLGLSPAAKDTIYKLDLKRQIILVVGSEGKGMGRLIKENCDLLATIPVLGKTESLNASVAAGIGLYEIARQNVPFPAI